VEIVLHPRVEDGETGYGESVSPVFVWLVREVPSMLLYSVLCFVLCLHHGRGEAGA
jgi:hypothetical protein